MDKNNLFSKANGDELWPFEISSYLRPRGTAQITTQCVVIWGGAGGNHHILSPSLIYIYLHKRGQALGPSGRHLARIPGAGMHFCHFEGQIIDKFEIGFFPIRRGVIWSSIFASLRSRDLENQFSRLKMLRFEIFNVSRC